MRCQHVVNVGVSGLLLRWQCMRVCIEGWDGSWVWSLRIGSSRTGYTLYFDFLIWAENCGIFDTSLTSTFLMSSKSIFRDDSIVNVLRTNLPQFDRRFPLSFCALSQPGLENLAFTEKNGKRVLLHLFPAPCCVVMVVSSCTRLTLSGLARLPAVYGTYRSIVCSCFHIKTFSQYRV